MSRETNETGMTLVELIIYAALLTVVVTIVGGMMLSAITAQRDITSSTSAASLGQLIGQSVTKGVRNATTIDPLQQPTATSQLLRVSSSAGKHTDGTLYGTVYEGWYYTQNNGGSFYMTISCTSIVAPTTPTLLAQWNYLGTGITPTAGGASLFTVANSTVSYGFSVANGVGKSILISSTAVSRQALTGGSACS